MTAVLIRAGQSLEPAIAALRAGLLVAVPTETVYGLAANALDEDACARIFVAKGRPRDNPLIVHVARREDIYDTRLVAAVPSSLEPVLDAFWPGPLTVLLPRGPAVPTAVSAGQPTVAVRMPSHPVARELIAACGFPLAAPSANLSGRPSPTTVAHVLADLGDRIAAAIDGGPCAVGLESTVLDATRSPPVILRPGAITAAMLRPFLPSVVLFSELDADAQSKEAARPSTPGMKYRHYAPDSALHLLRTADAADAFAAEQASHGRRVLLLTTDASRTYGCETIALSDTPTDYATIARNLFAALREADGRRPDAIVAAAVAEPEGAADADTGEALAIMNRLTKAAHVLH